MAIKHKYSVYGVSCIGGSLFTGTCVADDIIKAIELLEKISILYGILKEKNKLVQIQKLGLKV